MSRSRGRARIIPMTVRRSLLLICLIAAAHGLFFIWYQHPDWNTQWSDQIGYRRLGEVLASTGRFTRFPDTAQFTPEVIRTPGYPLFVASLYKIFGVGQLPVALAQSGVFVLIVLLVFAIARRVMSTPMAIAAAAVTSAFSPIPYFGALVLTEVWTTFLFTAAMWFAIRALDDQRLKDFALLGLLLALTSLTRPVFVLYPFALAGVGLVLFPAFGVRHRPAARHWAAMLGVFALTMLPWFAYNYVTLGRFTISPAGGIGRGLWEGSWQDSWSGRLHNELTHLADDFNDRPELDRQVIAVAAREHVPPAPMLTYVHQWQDIRRIWTEPVDPQQRAAARIAADQEYLRIALANLRRDSLPHLAHRFARVIFVLWAGAIPFRYSDINRLPPAVIYACWAIQSALMCLAVIGLSALIFSGQIAAACVLAAPLVYITAVHFPLLTDARLSLPAQPIVLILATIGTNRLRGRRSHDQGLGRQTV
jgi:hypothetical protein